MNKSWIPLAICIVCAVSLTLVVQTKAPVQHSKASRSSTSKVKPASIHTPSSSDITL